MIDDKLQTVLVDLAARFLLNLPASEFESFERLFFTVEEAHWFYLDFYRDHDKKLPALSLPEFASELFQQVDFLRPYVQYLEKHFADFQAYKREVPTAGVIALNQRISKVLLVRSWQRQHWSFPKGKIAKDETHLQCAIREFTEETGFDVSHYVLADTYIDAQLHGRPCRLFIAVGVPESAKFEPLARKEVSEVRWFPLLKLIRHVHARSEQDLQADWPAPARFHAVRPFLAWIREQCKRLRCTYGVKQGAGSSDLATRAACIHPGSVRDPVPAPVSLPVQSRISGTEHGHSGYAADAQTHVRISGASAPFFTAMTTTTVGSSDTRWTSSAPDTEVAWDPLEHFQLDQQQLLAIVDEAFGTVPRITADTR
ncbi:mRNA-decapping enzyme complex component DCP2 [Cyanidioschyzon merolae strain 10D]|jgi:8-oxo-dGTP pyrophosphatase MutT (NUDIX family)|uniref:mRNA-decapping enzyme complex component DCP2 n=1 Tax=Cyanidioschyzon merolae (strain NIES-3377 / 10D) TaxID=280699 RepID=M1V864_CYAM1|nr:mRNA-decapping enzyme complex component DCP2 [Cyanidioschyzon merolae strain 10D]BAM80339.1 mRNA-decapping enzyme complex component DCP2 [Cyanidioschyzon merolae strain 10D]|eukprot:XP_005534946.1 mRNA-decapping enzyme complex component DCP2 [Cyanidioschyzon merolae strain 10D]